MKNNFSPNSKVFRKARQILGCVSVFTQVLAPPFHKLGIVFLSMGYANPQRIGELAHQPDLYLKMGILGMGPSGRSILLARTESIANRCLMNYWRRYIHVISHPLLFYFLFPFAKLLEYNTAYVTLPNGQLVHKSQATVAVQKQWETEGRHPLLKLSPLDCERGWDCLHKLGIPEGAWFVCLHVREPGFLKEGDNPHHAYRNADVESYFLAVKTIVERGGWVVRMGDPTMKPLPPMEHVIDYAHSNIRSDWMDIFCCAQCHFLLGTTSGLFLVSFVFGIPCALTNFMPMSERAWSGRDIFIPKLYWSAFEDRYLTFEEALAPPLRHCYDGKIITSLGVRLVDNSPEEIKEVVEEMIDRMDGNLNYTSEDERLQKKFNSLVTYESYGVASRIGRNFLRKYARLLPNQ